MQPLQQLAWTLPEHFVLSDLHAALEETFELKPGPVKTLNRSWFDTFDWRLFRNQRLLIRERNLWVLQDFQGNRLAQLSSRRKTFRFSRDFPESPLRTALRKFLDVRALNELGVEKVETREQRMLNRDKKIVAFLELETSVIPGSDRKLVSVRLREVRGYSKRFRQAAECIGRFGVETLAGPDEALRFVLQGSGREPLDYSSGFKVPLDPQMTGIEAVGQIYRSLLESMRRNEQGVIDDIDTEFLHDLRVAVRRTRSALALIKGVLDPEVSDRFKNEFRYIGRMTGPVRDLDVYLLNEETYRAGLPDRLQEGLAYFFEDLAARRKQEQRRLVRSLGSPRYRQILADWGQLLDLGPELPAGKNGAVPIGVLAGKIIHKRFRRVLRDGKKIHQGTPDRELHRLRIEGKKLRYSLEFFAPLYDQQQMKKLIRQLKVLQNNLGDFNDLSVQQEMLSHYLSEIRPGTKKSKELAAAIGGLMTDLAVQHREVRTHFEETFARFAGRENLELYHAIFG